MSEIVSNSEKLKAILKGAIVELLQENRQEVSALLAEIIEDIAMERAIGESEVKSVNRDAIFQLLEPKKKLQCQQTLSLETKQ